MDAHGVVAAPSDHVTMLMDGVYAGRGLQPLAPIHRNRTDPVLTRDALTPEIEEMLAQRLGEDAKLSDAILARTQMAGRAVGDPIPTLRVQDDLATLVPAGQSVILFGAGMTTPRLIAWLRLKGVAVVAVLTTSGGGRVSEVPVLAIDEARGRFPETVGLIAAQAYAPAVRALTAAGCESIVDALDFTEALPDPAWTNMAPE
ncbi:hypothetical protein IP70_23390 [alpha proteobacterium AAP38]|nr:hypothetical protein IP70_23390 [alpha proteobacterium AAP38]